MTWESMINKNYLTYSPGWRKLGKKFYYPKCCIFNFSRNKCAQHTLRKRLSTVIYNKSIFNGFGYIPCHECMKKLAVKQKQMCRNILQKRKPIIPSKRFRNRNNIQKDKQMEKFWYKYEIYQTENI